jgi:HD superfamily phosphohydrolase YqeK
MIELPPWAKVSARRREHIARVTALLDEWARALAIPPDEARAWHDAGKWHDALRDAEPEDLSGIISDRALAPGLWHGPAAAARLRQDGERRRSLLEAITWHTVGHPDWDRVGRALYMADYLEPGRTFEREERAALAAAVPADFEGTYWDVVRHRMIWALRQGHALHPQTVAMWNTRA